MAASDSPTTVWSIQLGCLLFDSERPRAFDFDQKLTQNIAQILISLLNLCLDINIVLFFCTTLFNLEIILCSNNTLICALYFLVKRSIICEMAVHLRSQGYKLFHCSLNSFFPKPILFLLFPIDTGLLAS